MIPCRWHVEASVQLHLPWLPRICSLWIKGGQDWMSQWIPSNTSIPNNLYRILWSG